MRYPLLASRLYGAPLLLHPDKAAVIETVFRAHANGQAAAPSADFHVPKPEAVAYAADRFADKPFVLTDGGIAVIPVIGSLVQRASGLDVASGLTSYGWIEKRFTQALADPDVKGILFEHDSPGGEASGVFDLAEMIAASTKPVWASANEMAMSGSYALAAAADRILVPRTARVGSIGVIAMFVDQSKRDTTQGYAYTAIFAGARKNDGNPHEPLSSPAKKRLQGMVDGLYVLFVDHVAAARGLTVEAVRATEAATFSAEEAIAAGFADDIQSFNDTLAEFEAFVSQPQGVSTTGGFRLSQGAKMQTPQASPAEPQAPAASTTDPAPTVSAPVETAASVADPAAAERERIQSILTHAESSGRAEMAQHLAFKTTMASADAVALLAAAPKEAAPAPAASQHNALAAAMAAVKNPTVGADPSGDTDQGAQANASWNRAFSKVAPMRAVK